MIKSKFCFFFVLPGSVLLLQIVQMGEARLEFVGELDRTAVQKRTGAV